MRTLAKWGAGACGLLVVLLTVSASLAAPSSQDEEPPTPTPTGTVTPPIFFSTVTPTSNVPTATFTPTPTQRPLLEGAGVVQVETLVVRAGPEQRWYPLGVLAYNEYVYPIGRDDSLWVAIEWQGEQEVGWIASLLVVWDESVNLEALPLLEWPSVITPLAPGTATPTVLPTMTLQPTVTPTSLASPTGTLPPTSTPAPPTPTEIAPTVTATAEAVAAVPKANATDSAPATLPEGPPVEPTSAIDINSNVVVWGTIGILGLGLVAYVGRYLWGIREQSRYDDGFVIDECLACQVGELELDELAYQNIGLTRIKRSVRCDVCRSVFRQIRPGTWRYYIDPLVNPKLATEYNARQFSDTAILRLQEHIDDYPSELPPPEGDEYPSPEEVIAELEARYEAAIVNEVANIIEEEERVLDDAHDDIFADLLGEDEGEPFEDAPPESEND